MKILDLKILQGPNYWSNNRKRLIVIKLDLQKYEHLPTHKIPDFSTRLKTLIPSLYEHRCSPGKPGGFFYRLDEGTWLGHVIEHIALELQWLAGMPCGFGRTFAAHEEGIYHVIFSYLIPSAGIYAAERAVNIAQTLAEGRDYLHLANDLDELKRLYEEEKLGPSTQAIVDEAEARGIPYFRHQGSLLTLGYGCQQKKVWAALTSSTSAIGMDLVSNKELTKQILADQFIPVPMGGVIDQLDELDAMINSLGFPLVIKPLNGNHGRGVTTNIRTKEKALQAVRHAQTVSHSVIVEKFIKGNDYRFLVINFEVVAVAKRTPASIIGTGKHSIQELINIENSNPKRGTAHENLLTKIKIDAITHAVLNEHNLSLDSILPKGQEIFLKDTANLSAGGTAEDVTDWVHPANKKLAERAARMVNLNICGIDIIAEDISQIINAKTGAIIEVNAGPGLRMHLAPNAGKARNVAQPLLNMLYPEHESFTIPIVAVTGTNGKTTVVRLIAHLANTMNHFTGFTTTDGIYLQNKLIYKGDCSGPKSAKVILQNPQVSFAVLECARGGILRAGLGFDECDISIITNISSDHLGLNDIHTLEELTRVKSVLAHSTKSHGYAILNAEDDLVYSIKNKLDCNVALFAAEKNNRLVEHAQAGGLVSYVENGQVIIQKDKKEYQLMEIKRIPLTFNGTASAMIQNVLPAVLTGVICDFSFAAIEQALMSFYPTPKNLPGRMNKINFDNCQILIDYAHNEAAFIELGKYLSAFDQYKIGIVAAPGDRRDTDIEKLGYLAANLFDEVIIRHDKDTRGRANYELSGLLLKGINSNEKKVRFTIISDEFEALKYAISSAEENAIVFHTAEDVFKTLEFIHSEKEKLKQPI